MKKNKNGVPSKIEIPVYYTIYDGDKILYDKEEMQEALGNILDALPTNLKVYEKI